MDPSASDEVPSPLVGAQLFSPTSVTGRSSMGGGTTTTSSSTGTAMKPNGGRLANANAAPTHNDNNDPNNNNNNNDDGRTIIPITISQPGRVGGMNIRRINGYVRVAAVIPNTPASAACVQPGDYLATADTADGSSGSDQTMITSSDQFRQLCSGLRPIKFNVIRTVLPINLTQAGPLGLTVVDYKPPNMGSMAAGYTRIAAVESNSQAHAAGLRVGDFITYPGTKGGVAIPENLFSNTLSTFRPLVFDVLRPGLDFDALGSINNSNTGTRTSAATSAAAASSSSTRSTTGSVASATSSWPTASSAKAPANANGGAYASAAATAKPPPHRMVDRTNSSSASVANTSKKPVKAEPSGHSASSSAVAAAASRQVEVIELLSDSDEEMTSAPNTSSTFGSSRNTVPSSSSSSSANRSWQVQQRTVGPARTGTATHRQPGTMRFPPTIDIGFNGNERNMPKNAQGYREESYGYRHGQYQVTGSTDVRLKEIRHIQRSTSQIGELKFIWPTETPVSLSCLFTLPLPDRK